MEEQTAAQTLAHFRAKAAERRMRQRHREKQAHVPSPEVVVQALAYGLRAIVIDRGGLKGVERGSDLYRCIQRASRYLDTRGYDLDHQVTRSRLQGAFK